MDMRSTAGAELSGAATDGERIAQESEEPPARAAHTEAARSGKPRNGPHEACEFSGRLAVPDQRSASTRCVSLRRAPAMMPSIPMLPSWQAYSNSGPSVRRKGIIAVHGPVRLFGSSTVNS